MDRVFENPLRVVDMGQTDDDVLVAVSPVDRTVSEDEALSPRPDRAQLAVRKTIWSWRCCRNCIGLHWIESKPREGDAHAR